MAGSLRTSAPVLCRDYEPKLIGSPLLGRRLSALARPCDLHPLIER